MYCYGNKSTIKCTIYCSYNASTQSTQTNVGSCGTDRTSNLFVAVVRRAQDVA